MKLPLALALLLGSPLAFAEFATWTNKEGRSAELELVKVTEKAGEKVGEFRTRAGKTVTLKASQLDSDGATRLDEWKPAAKETAAGPSIYDDLLDGNLVALNGKKVAKLKDHAKPTKHYVFYYSASWCAPCQKFTPSLVEFYNKNKNAGFEVYFISSDSDEGDMEFYMQEKEMPWPALKLGSKTEKFKKEVRHAVKGIPFIAVTDADGKIVEQGNAYQVLPKLKGLLAP